MSRKVDRIAFVHSEAPEAIAAAKELERRYGQSAPEEADVIVVLGGDGIMLQTLHRTMNRGTPVYGLNRGSVGFLMNEYRLDGLRERLLEATSETLRPLAMSATTSDGVNHTALAINEVSLLRQSFQAAKLRVSIDGKIRLEELICDGIMVATPAGSTAYNLSAHGPILPIDAQLLALTPVSAFRPRRWRGALVPVRATIRFDVLEPEKRPVNAVADFFEVKSVCSVTVRESTSSSATLLFDANHSWDERILNEQFRY